MYRLPLILIACIVFYSCTKDENPEPVDPANNFVRKIVEIDRNRDSAVAEFSYSNNGLITGYTIKGYTNGTMDIFYVIACFYNPDNSLQSVRERVKDYSGGGDDNRFDYTCLRNAGDTLITGIKKYDSSVNFTYYDRWNYNTDGKLVTIYNRLDSLEYAGINTPSYITVDSIVYFDGNIDKLIMYQPDFPAGGMSVREFSDYDIAPKFFPQGINSFIIFDYQFTFLSQNNERAELLRFDSGDDLEVTVDITYDNSDRPIHMIYTYSDPLANTGPGLFMNARERHIYY